MGPTGKEPRIRIAFFSRDLPSDRPNGVSVQVHRLAVALCGRGHDVTCFSLSPAPEGAPYRTVTLAPRSPNGVYGKLQPALLFRSVNTKDFDVVHYHGDDYLCAGSRRRVRTFYGSALSEALHAGMASRAAYQGAFYLFEWTSCLRRGATAGISRATLSCLPLVKHRIACGVALDRYAPGGEKTAYPSILFLGSLCGRKRGALAVAAFNAAVRPRFPSAVLTVVGPERPVGDGIEWLGRIGEERLIEEYRKAWVLCIASSYEGFGVPAVEAMACGTPVVSVRNAGIAEIAGNGGDAILCGAGELGEALAACIGDDAMRQRLRTAGLETARAYDIQATAAAYEELYRSAFDGAADVCFPDDKGGIRQ